MDDKKSAIEQYVRRRYAEEPFLTHILHIVRPPNKADSERECVSFVEVNAASIATNRIGIFSFRPSESFPYYFQVAEVTPREFEKIQNDRALLPEDWDLDRAEFFQRS